MQNLNRVVLTSEKNKRKREEDDAPATTSFLSRHGNRLLAGYLAHQFLTKGKLLGEPARSVAAPMKPDSYAEVVSLLQAGGTHIPGIVNPAELARWIRL